MSDLSRTLVVTGNGGRDNKYQYNGIEHIDEYGLCLNHTLFRSYDYQLGTWGQIDPLAETPGLNRYGGYTHVYDNPISYADPLGLCHNCPENANKGDAHTWAGQEFIYDGERWSAMLPETEVKSAPKSTDSEMWASYGKAMGEFGDMMEILVGLMMVPEGGLVTSGASFAVKGVSNLVDDALKVGANLADDAAKTSPKLITQFSTRTIDDAVDLVMNDPNKISHLFDHKHNLGDLVSKLGGQQKTVLAVLNAANGRLPAKGVFNNIPVSVGGQTILLRGSVIDGVPRLGTMFIR